MNNTIEFPIELFLTLISYYYYHILIIVGIYFFLLSLANHYEMKRFSFAADILDGPMVSVLIPARNEEQYIEQCVNSLLNQSYKNYEILVLNDNSTDGTLDIINRIAASDKRVRVFNGKPLPDDWYGKPFAQHQLTSHAKGEILVFTDADTIHTSSSIAWAVTNIKNNEADMISGYIGQILHTFGEKITVPLMFFLTGFALPVFLNRFVKVSWLSTAIGQYIVIRKTVFDAIGGCESFKKENLEDMYLSRHVKRKGFTTRFLDITAYVKCRMYNGYQATIRGIGRNLIDFFGKSAVILFFLIIGVIFFLFLPFPLLIYNGVTLSPWIYHNIAITCLYTLTWIFVFRGQRLKWWYGFLSPVLFINLIYMASWAWFRKVSGKGFSWKGRAVS